MFANHWDISIDKVDAEEMQEHATKYIICERSIHTALSVYLFLLRRRRGLGRRGLDEPFIRNTLELSTVLWVRLHAQRGCEDELTDCLAEAGEEGVEWLLRVGLLVFVSFENFATTLFKERKSEISSSSHMSLLFGRALSHSVQKRGLREG